MSKRRFSLIEQLDLLIKKANSQDISIKMIMETLAGKGQALMLIMFCLPFCQPILLPGLSTLFGIMLALIGLRISFGRSSWLPKKILEKKISYATLKKITFYTTKIVQKLRFLIATRWIWIVKNPILHIIHGLTITLLAILLALPLPIPLTNLLAAYPILAFGLGLLEDDGVLIVMAYILSIVAFSAFISLFLFGKEGFMHLYKLF